MDSTVPPENRFLVRFPDCAGFSEFASDSPLRPSSRPSPHYCGEAFPSRFLVRTGGPSRFPQSRPCDVTLVCTLPLLALRPNSISCSQEDSQTSCFRRLFRSHGPTLTLSVPEPLCRVVLLSSAKTLRRNCGLHATPVGLRIQQHPPIPGMLGDRLLQASFPLSRADLDPRGS